MQYYALSWRPRTDNLGHDLTALAAMQHLPRVDFVLDAEALDAPLPVLKDDDRVVTLITSHFLTAPHHWPPGKHISPACAGVHISLEDAWGMPITSLDGAGKDALAAISSIAARDQRTADRLTALGIASSVTGDITLTLRHEEVPRRGILCCDVAAEVVDAIRRHRSDVTCVTHEMPAPSPDFQLRMDAAREMLHRYAAAEMVFTRRLHCAMTCLAVGTPVLLLYHPEYEDIGRFAPMDGLVRRQGVEDFLREVHLHGLPVPWRAPGDIYALQRAFDGAIADALHRAESRPLPLVAPEAAAQWRAGCIDRMLERAKMKIARLENEHYAGLHAKFERLAMEDGVKATLHGLLAHEEVREGLRAAWMRQQMERLAPKDQKMLRALHRQGSADADELIRQAEEALQLLGWPDGQDTPFPITNDAPDKEA